MVGFAGSWKSPDSGGEHPYQSVDSLIWCSAERAQGKTIRIMGFPKDHKVRWLRWHGLGCDERPDWNAAKPDVPHSEQSSIILPALRLI